ncbi:S8 family peptidase [Bacillus sp. APMAM]|nr:S8 family peptidase [Bacillus sp. APMAM]RTZ55913.1 hypothetical protein EKO25_10600 [Bacillus sp. SAJ1]
MKVGDVLITPFQVKEITKKIKFIPEGVRLVGAPAAWEKGITGEGIVVAVIDSGCQIDHPNLKRNIIGGYNFTNDDNGNPRSLIDYISHGTHVAGIIAASSDNGGIKGVAPDARLLILKVINSKGESNYNTLIKALNYALKWQGPNGEKVSVINLSLGGVLDDEELHRTIIKIVENGVVVVTAAGNIGDNNIKTDEILYPGYYEEVIEVGSINNKKEPSFFSNSNNQIDFVAPGNDVLSTFPSNNYAKLSGTSMAAPHVTGVIVLLLSTIDSEKLHLYDIYLQLAKNAIQLGIGKNFEGNGLIHT